MIVHAHPTDIEHYDATIKAKVDIKRIKAFISDVKILNRLKKTSYSIWGIAPGPQNTKKFDKIILGDICLMYYKQKFHTTGKIIATFNNHDFAKELWGIKDDTEKTWEHMFVIDDLRDINIKLEEFNNTVKTQKGNYYKLRELRGFISLNEENSNALIERFSLVNAPQLDEEDDYPDPESDPTKPKKGQQYSKKHKKIIEEYAMDVVYEKYSSEGYIVEDVSNIRPSYGCDFICVPKKSGKGIIYCEVKGLTGSDEYVYITKNEYEKSKEYGNDSVLCIVSHIDLDYDIEPPVASGGHLKILHPWEPNDPENCDPYVYKFYPDDH